MTEKHCPVCGWAGGSPSREDFLRVLQMLARPRHIDHSLLVPRYEERPWGFLVHAVGAIPIWGFVFNAAVWLYFRHRSREMVFHVQQAVQFHIIILIPILLWNIIGVFTAVIAELSPSVALVLETFSTFLLVAFLSLAAAVALFGGLLVYMGRPFLYPIIGKKVLEGTLAKLTGE